MKRLIAHGIGHGYLADAAEKVGLVGGRIIRTVEQIVGNPKLAAEYIDAVATAAPPGDGMAVLTVRFPRVTPDGETRTDRPCTKDEAGPLLNALKDAGKYATALGVTLWVQFGNEHDNGAGRWQEGMTVADHLEHLRPVIDGLRDWRDGQNMPVFIATPSYYNCLNMMQRPTHAHGAALFDRRVGTLQAYSALGADGWDLHFDSESEAACIAQIELADRVRARWSTDNLMMLTTEAGATHYPNLDDLDGAAAAHEAVLRTLLARGYAAVGVRPWWATPGHPGYQVLACVNGDGSYRLPVARRVANVGGGTLASSGSGGEVEPEGQVK